MKKYLWAVSTAVLLAPNIALSSNEQNNVQATESNLQSSESQEQSKSVSLYSLRATSFIGADVKNYQGEAIGEVKDLVVSRDENQVLAVLDVGGFLNMGEHRVAIPLAELRIYNGGADVRANKTEAQLKSMQEFDYGKPYHTSRVSSEISTIN